MNNKNKKKIFVLLYAYFVILLFPKINNSHKKTEYNNEYNNESYCYATYNGKNIYIANELIIDSLDKNNNDIYIIDSRNDSDPNIAINNSYRINNIYDIKRIIKILEQYENDYPSDWNRTYNSMVNEWIIHNIGYQLGINRDSSRTVDLNNKDEDDYNNIIKLLLKKEDY